MAFSAFHCIRDKSLWLFARWPKFRPIKDREFTLSTGDINDKETGKMMATIMTLMLL